MHAWRLADNARAECQEILLLLLLLLLLLNYGFSGLARGSGLSGLTSSFGYDMTAFRRDESRCTVPTLLPLHGASEVVPHSCNGAMYPAGPNLKHLMVLLIPAPENLSKSCLKPKLWPVVLQLSLAKAANARKHISHAALSTKHVKPRGQAYRLRSRASTKSSASSAPPMCRTQASRLLMHGIPIIPTITVSSLPYHVWLDDGLVGMLQNPGGCLHSSTKVRTDTVERSRTSSVRSCCVVHLLHVSEPNCQYGLR